MGYGPQQDLIAYQFAMDYLYAPQQSMSRFYNRVQPEVFNAAQKLVNIVPQVDGQDFDYNSAGTNKKPFSESPFQQFPIQRIGFRVRGHALSHAIERTQLFEITPDYRSILAGRFAGSAARFRDRVLLYNSDSHRIIQQATVSASDLGTTTEDFPHGNKYIIANKDSSNVVSLGRLDLQTLEDMKLRFMNNEIYDSNGMNPVCIASPTQIQNLLTETKLTSMDFNTVRTLVRGEVNSFMGFEFLYCKAGQALTATPPLYRRDTTAFTDRGDVRNTSTGTYTTRVTQEPEKVIFCMAYDAFSAGEIPMASYMNVWENPLRNGVWEYIFQTMIGYRRKQNEYIQIAYGAKATQPGVEIRRTPVKQADYFDNYSASGANWGYTATPA